MDAVIALVEKLNACKFSVVDDFFEVLDDFEVYDDLESHGVTTKLEGDLFSLVDRSGSCLFSLDLASFS